MLDPVLDSVSDNNSSSHVVSEFSVLLNVGNAKGLGHLFLHLLTVTGLSSVSLLYDVLGSWTLVVFESM